MRILIASLPRSGSTMLFRAISGLPHKKTTPKDNPYCAFVRDLTNIPNKPFLKTHSPAPNNLPADIRVIYIFGDPIKAIISTKNKRWNKDSWIKNNWFHDQEPDIFNKDDLGLEKNFDSWITQHNYSVLAVRFESLWLNKNILSKYLGFNFKLPKQQKRTTHPDLYLQNHLELVYDSLSSKIKNIDDLLLINSNKILKNPSYDDIPNTPKWTSSIMQTIRLKAWYHEKTKRNSSSLINF